MANIRMIMRKRSLVIGPLSLVGVDGPQALELLNL